MKSRWPALSVLVASSIACTRAAPAPEPQPRYGAVMAEVGQRFERAGRAASAGRFELASFEIGELEELFEGDLPHAELPKEGHTGALVAERAAFVKAYPARLKAAAAARDLSAFRAAFADAAAACNACHRGSDHGFIEIPTQLDKPVPDLDPVQ